MAPFTGVADNKRSTGISVRLTPNVLHYGLKNMGMTILTSCMSGMRNEFRGGHNGIQSIFQRFE